MKNAIFAEKEEFTALFKSLKKEINGETLVETGFGEKPGLEITIGFYFDEETQELDWNYQTGDNSYTGPVYSFKNWVTTTLFRNTNSANLAEEVCQEISNTVAMAAT